MYSIRKIFIGLLCMALILLPGCGLSMDDFSLDNPGFESSQEETLMSFNDVVDKVNKEISDGTDGTIAFYVSEEVSDSELKNINYSIDTMKGNVTSITTYTSSIMNPGSRKVELLFERSDAMYAYDNIISGKEIPQEKTNAIELTSKCKIILSEIIMSAMSDYEKEIAIHDYIVNNCVYGSSDNHDDSEYTPYGVLVNGKAVCSGYASAMNLLLSCCGVEIRVVSGKAYSNNGESDELENHAWNQVKINGNWYNVDATWDDPVGDTETLSHEFFNVNDDILSDSHIWEKSKYEVCSSMSENYYVHTGSYISDIYSLESYLKTNLVAGINNEAECALNNFEVNDENLQFIFGIDGVETVGYSLSGNVKYNILKVYINR